MLFVMVVGSSIAFSALNHVSKSIGMCKFLGF